MDKGGCVVSCISISAHTLRPISSNCSFINKRINYSQYCLLFLSVETPPFPKTFLLSLHITNLCKAKKMNSLLKRGPGRKAPLDSLKFTCPKISPPPHDYKSECTQGNCNLRHKRTIHSSFAFTSTSFFYCVNN